MKSTLVSDNISLRASITYIFTNNKDTEIKGALIALRNVLNGVSDNSEAIERLTVDFAKGERIAIGLYQGWHNALTYALKHPQNITSKEGDYLLRTLQFHTELHNAIVKRWL